ncbi:MAG: hypothetical protein ABI203_02220 [Mucilaginibacter sp.]
MTKPANSTNKPSPADTPTKRPNDNGHKSIQGSDNDYTTRKLERLNIEKKREQEEKPIKLGDSSK